MDEPKLYSNRYAGFGPAWEACGCSISPRDPESPPTREFHLEHSDPAGEAWQQLVALIDQAAVDGREVFPPSKEIPTLLWRQIVTLPASIGTLTAVKDLNLYGSNLIAIPPEIGDMVSLENFQPYTSRRLHLVPIRDHAVRCAARLDGEHPALLRQLQDPAPVPVAASRRP